MCLRELQTADPSLRGKPVLGDDLAGDFPGFVEGEVSGRPQRATPPMLPGDAPSFMPTGLHPQQQATHLRVPELVGAILGLGCCNKTLGEGGD